MIFPCGLPDRGKKKRKKICNYENCPYLCSVVWFQGQFYIALAALFKTKNRMFECPLYHSSTRKYKHESGFSPYNEVEVIVRGLFLFYI